VKSDTKLAAGVLVNKSGRKITDPTNPSQVDEESAPVKKEVVAAKPKRASVSRTKKVVRQPRQSSRTTSKAEKLVCRYCGSDDLSPSFKKRRDARCRACFKRRYGSATRSKRTTQTRKANARK
jgi:hypothetical protein